MPCGDSRECPDATCTATACLCTGKICAQIACTDDFACTPGEFCAASGHCLPRGCDASSDCPADFDCTGPGGICDRRMCVADGQCSNYCLEGLCFSARGECKLPAS